MTFDKIVARGVYLLLIIPVCIICFVGFLLWIFGDFAGAAAEWLEEVMKNLWMSNKEKN